MADTFDLQDFLNTYNKGKFPRSGQQWRNLVNDVYNQTNDYTLTNNLINSALNSPNPVNGVKPSGRMKRKASSELRKILSNNSSSSGSTSSPSSGGPSTGGGFTQQPPPVGSTPSVGSSASPPNGGSSSLSGGPTSLSYKRDVEDPSTYRTYDLLPTQFISTDPNKPGLMSLEDAKKKFEDPNFLTDYNIRSYEQLVEEHTFNIMDKLKDTSDDTELKELRSNIESISKKELDYIKDLNDQLTESKVKPIIEKDTKAFNDTINRQQDIAINGRLGVDRVKKFKDIIDSTSAGSHRRFSQLRKAVGQEYDAIAKGYSEEITDLYRKFMKNNPKGDFNTELAKPNSVLAKEKFDIDRKYATGLQRGEEALVSVVNELDAIEGKNAHLTGNPIKDGIVGMAMDSRSSKMSTRINEAYNNFNSVTITNADGITKNYETMIHTTNEKNANGNVTGERQLLAREIDSSGNRGDWVIIDDHKAQNRFVLALQDNNAHKTLDDDAIRKIGKELNGMGIEGLNEIPTNTNGVSGFSRTTYQQGNNAMQYVNTRGGSINGNPVRRFADYVDMKINNPGKRLEKEMRAEASKLARTSVAENSGIFKSIAAAASEHPFIAGMIAVGGFGLASKALDRRREYN